MIFTKMELNGTTLLAIIQSPLCAKIPTNFLNLSELHTQRWMFLNHQINSALTAFFKKFVVDYIIKVIIYCHECFFANKRILQIFNKGFQISSALLLWSGWDERKPSDDLPSQSRKESILNCSLMEGQSFKDINESKTFQLNLRG